MSAYTCPTWCMGDHGPREGTPGNCVGHRGADVVFGQENEQILARLEFYEGTTDGSDGHLIYIDQPNSSDALRPRDARALARQLVEWAEMVGA